MKADHHHNTDQEKIKQTQVVLGNTFANPRTMMMITIMANLANITMVNITASNNFAKLAESVMIDLFMTRLLDFACDSRVHNRNQ